ncbi:hypothetical protein [Rufibacter radiotolerans]|uniref:hypothetical protein n=1 Tax=Rufibacter radiotolerans TaxID=1379910 RepID=UPI000664696B|nr:hypothetical protein [Rufibacter radiotolerans]
MLLNACSSASSDFNFDSDTWKKDLNGCQGLRQKQQGKIEEIRLDLVGLKEYKIRQLLGKPDLEELLERSQKIYIYFIAPGPKCQTGAAAKKVAFTVRMDALGTVREANLLEE